MMIRRVEGMRYKNLFENVNIFEDNMKNLRYQTQTFNDWQQKCYDLRQGYYGVKGRKKLLVKMSESKYHKKVVGMLEGFRRQKGMGFNRFEFVQKFSEVCQNKKDENKRMKMVNKNFDKNIVQSPNVENEIRLSGTRMKINMKKKVLQRHWSKIDSYRKEYRVCNTDRILHTGVQQKNILRKVVKNRSSSTCGFREYGNLMKSSFSQW